MKAYGSLTIVDLLDTATYIYYAEDEKGTGATKAPNAKSKYMGIYSGPPFTGNPTKFPMDSWESDWWTGWQKYVGEDGAPGTPGTSVTITSTSIKYAVSNNGQTKPTTDWGTTIPTVNSGQYLWTWTQVKYSDGKSTDSYSVSYMGKDGSDANSDKYSIEFSLEEILKFATETEAYTYSSDTLTILIKKNGALATDLALAMSVQGSDITDKGYLTLTQNGNYTFAVKRFLEDNTAIKLQPSISFIFKIRDASGTDLAVRPIICRNGLKSEMATFAIHAADITAAIQSTALKFDASGLTVYNGGLKIVRKTNGQEENVFYGDGSGNLYLKGEVTATSGFIGDIKIENGSLVSGEAYTISPTGIIANSITLRSGAIIDDYIKLGNSYLYNPDAKDANGKLIRPSTSALDRVVLASGNLLIKDNNSMSLGTISFYGGNDSEQAYISSQNNQWKIWENGRADFKNIYADNCHIGNTILETNTIQSAGNLTIYADSWTLVGVENKAFLVDKDPMLSWQGKSIILFGKNKYYEVNGEITKSNGIYKIPVKEDVSDFSSGDVITKIGKIGEAVMSVSGQGSESVGFATENSLTLAFVQDFSNNTPTFDTKLSLGLLDKLGKGMTGYGLYAENVYLKGSLTTISSKDTGAMENATYAGVNTTTGVSATRFNSTSVGGTAIDDTSAIIFWAGAFGPEAEAIQAAPFQVTEKGTLYAAQGVFEGSIISKSVIQGSDIYAARIHGWENENGAPLTIYDTDLGIVFKSGFQQDEETILEIGTKGLLGKNKNPIITLKESGSQQLAEFFGRQLSATLENRRTILDANGIFSYVSDEANSWDIASSLDLDNGITLKDRGVQLASFNSELIHLQTAQVTLQQNVQFGESVNLLYKQTSTGYDLYVN